MEGSNQLSSSAFKQIAKGYAQMRLAHLSTAREAVVWGFQGADNIVSGLLEVSSVPFNKKSHRDKWEKFTSNYPGFLQRVPGDQIDLCRRIWEDARYSDRQISAGDTAQVLALADKVFEFGLERFGQATGISKQDLEQAVDAAIEAELAVIKVKEIEDYLQAREANAEQDAVRWGFARYSIILGDPATYTHFSLQADEPEVQRLIETEADIARKIADAYKSFVEAVTKIALKRVRQETLQMLGDEKKISREQGYELLKSLASALEFNLVLRFSFLGYNFLENVEQVAEVVRALKEGRVELVNPRVVQESSPRIVQYKTRIRKEL